MMESQRVKRQSAHEPSQDNHQYPPEFWDGLSKVPLTHRALKALERRNCARPSYPTRPTRVTQDATPPDVKELAQFARHGGPDLRDLRVYPPATSNEQHAGTTTTKKLIMAHQRAYEQYLVDNKIHPIWKSRKPELDDTRAALAARRASLSPSEFSDKAFETFQNTDARAKDEDDVKLRVIPIIFGASQADHPYAMNTVFGNLESLIDKWVLPSAEPDFYYGADPEELDRSIRVQLGSHIIPSTMQDKPMVPNFFLEVKGPDGHAAVATRQTRHNGGVGARAMNSLQNYGKEELDYDGQAYTYSSTYGDGHLKIYAHHITAPTAKGRKPGYHTTLLRSFSMTDTRETFVQGATAFRNARDLAKQHRDSFIRAANTRAFLAGTAVSEDLFNTFGESSSPHESHRSTNRLDYSVLMHEG